jgi:hypothetical protein
MTMLLRRLVIVAGLFCAVPVAARQPDEPPCEIAKSFLEQFHRDACAIQAKADQEIDARKKTLLADLKAMRDSLTKAGNYDEALAVQQTIRNLHPPHQLEHQPRQIEVEWGGTWWTAEVLKEEAGRYYIHYIGWADNWNEWVTKERIRPPTAPALGRPNGLQFRPAP